MINPWKELKTFIISCDRCGRVWTEYDVKTIKGLPLGWGLSKRTGSIVLCDKCKKDDQP